MVYALPLYHPIRMIEEICMLDQMSHGRLEIGFGRGSVGIELAYYGEDPKLAQEVYAEALELVLKGLTEPSLTFHGKFFNFDNVPMELVPLQKPYPPVWYGLHAPESAKRAARKRLAGRSASIPVPATRAVVRRLPRRRGARRWGDTPLPLMGLGRFIVVADTDAEALALARRAYPRWHTSFTHLHRRHNRQAAHPRPPEFDGIAEVGQGVAGSPRTVAGVPARAACRDRQQLLRRAVRVWRSVAGGNAAVDRAVCARGDAGIAVRGAGGRGLIFGRIVPIIGAKLGNATRRLTARSFGRGV